MKRSGEMETLQAGDQVTAIYKTGKYAGVITGAGDRTFTVRVSAVLKHPVQGDLHHPKETEGVFFHERKALAYREQANVPKNMVKPYSGEMPDYTVSLKQAVKAMKEKLQMEDTPFNSKSLDAHQRLEEEYKI